MKPRRLQPRLQNGARKVTTRLVRVGRNSKKEPLCATRLLVCKSRRGPDQSSPWNQIGPAPPGVMPARSIQVAAGILVQAAALEKEVVELAGSAMTLIGMVTTAVVGVVGTGMAVAVVAALEKATLVAAVLLMVVVTAPTPRTATPAAMARVLVLVGRLGG